MLGPLPDEARSILRATVARIQSELTRLEREPDVEGAHARLHEQWTKLVDQLALGSEPEYRECARCGHVAIRAARRCGWCWERLSPLPTSS